MAKKDGIKGGKVLKQHAGDQIHVGPVTFSVEKVANLGVVIRIQAPSEMKITTTEVKKDITRVG